MASVDAAAAGEEGEIGEDNDDEKQVVEVDAPGLRRTRTPSFLGEGKKWVTAAPAGRPGVGAGKMIDE